MQEITDKVEWTQATKFKLDDGLRFDQSDAPRVVTSSYGTPGLCVKPGCGSVTNIWRVGDSLLLDLIASNGHWNEDTERMDFDLSLQSDGPESYLVFDNCPGNSEPTPFFGGACNFNYGGTVHLSPSEGRYSIPSEYIHRKEGTRVTVKIYLTLEPVCP